MMRRQSGHSSSIAVEEVEVIPLGGNWQSPSKTNWAHRNEALGTPGKPMQNDRVSLSGSYTKWSSSPRTARRSGHSRHTLARIVEPSHHSESRSTISYTSGGYPPSHHIQGILPAQPPALEASPPPSPHSESRSRDSTISLSSPLQIPYENLVIADNEEEAFLDEGAQDSIRIVESGGLALAEAQRAFYGSHRRAEHRFYWILPSDHDLRVVQVLNWVESMSWALATLGVHKFLATGSRGALLTNVTYRAEGQPTVDWITFGQSQKTYDRTLQESIASYDPATTTLVFVFLVSKFKNSVGMWRRKLPVPTNIQADFSFQLEDVKSAVPKADLRVHREAKPQELLAGKVVHPIRHSPQPTVTELATQPPNASTPSIVALGVAATPPRIPSSAVIATTVVVDSLPKKPTTKPTKPSRWKKLFKWGSKKKQRPPP